MHYNHSSMRKVHLVKCHVVHVYWIHIVYVQNNLPPEFSKRTIFIIYRKYAKNAVIFHGLWAMKRKHTCSYKSIILEKYFSRKHTKNSNANVWAHPDVTFWVVRYHTPPPPPESQLAFHIYYEKYENTLTCKRISWNSGGGMMF